MINRIKNYWNKKKKWEKASYTGMYIFLCSAFFVYFANELVGWIGIIIGAIMMVVCSIISDFKMEWIKDETEEVGQIDNK